jgi:7-carboxy-7-deazaguanine synthase
MQFNFKEVSSRNHLMKLPIYEHFYTWQGEGTHVGRAAYFIRTQGCPVKCPWCDSAGTWHRDYIPNDIKEFTADELAEAASKAGPEIVVITGGEPTIHDLSELTKAINAKGLPVHLETSGAFEIREDFAWITVSPKKWKSPLMQNIQKANEIKIIVEDADTVDFWMSSIGDWINTRDVWLVPEWSKRNSPDVLKSINDKVKAYGKMFRAGYQQHKLYNVDTESANARAHTPLGGDPRRGY